MAAREAGPPRGKTLQSGSLELHYHDYPGAGENGRTVVLVHGSGPGASGYSNFKLNAPALAAQGYRVLLPDLPGFGYSSKPEDIDYTTDFFAEHLTALLDGLGIERWALVGNSLGGAVCIRMALDHPGRVDKLVLMAPGGIEDLPTYMAMPAMAEMIATFTAGALDRIGLRSLLHNLVFDPAVVTDELVEERFAIAQSQPPAVLGRMHIPNMEKELAKIACPVLVFWGADDAMLPAGGGRKVLNACRPCRLIEVADCGHWVMVEHARMFNATCLDFLSHD